MFFDSAGKGAVHPVSDHSAVAGRICALETQPQPGMRNASIVGLAARCLAVLFALISVQAVAQTPLSPKTFSYHWRSIQGLTIPPAPALGTDPDGVGLYFDTGVAFPAPDVGIECFNLQKVIKSFYDPIEGSVDGQYTTWSIILTGPPGTCSATYRNIDVVTAFNIYSVDLTFQVTNTAPQILASNFNAPVGQTTTIVLANIASDPDADPLTLQANGAASGAGCGTVSVTAGGVSITPSAGGGTCSVPVRVTDSVDTVDATLTFASAAPPTVTALAPASGPQAGGASVVITGSSFAEATAVSFGAAPATAFTVDSATQITALAPAGTGTVNVTVTTPAGTSDTAGTADDYVYTAASANADLASLVLSQGTLSPTFASGTTSYTASVANAVASLTLSPTAADAGATIAVNGIAVTSGAASSAIALAVGANTITTVVTAADGTTTRTYTVVVTRASNVADLSVTIQGSYGPGAGLAQFTIVVSNPGPADVLGAVVASTVPSGVTASQFTCAGAGGATCGGPATGSDINRAVDLPTGSSVTFSVIDTLAASQPETITRNASVTAPMGIVDPGATNNTASVTLVNALFANGFEATPGSAAAVVLGKGMPGAWNEVALPLDLLADVMVGRHPVEALGFVRGESAMFVQLRRFDGRVQAQLLVRTGTAAWTGGDWLDVPKGGLGLSWLGTADGEAVEQAMLRR